MNKSTFIKELSILTNLSEEDSMIVNDILENNFFISKKNMKKIIEEIVVKLDVNFEEARNIYDISIGIVNNEIKKKLKHPFINKT